MSGSGAARARPLLKDLVAQFGRERSVFINGPYDSGFQPQFDAIVLAILSCGFLPRCALEHDVHSMARMERIIGALRGSKYSIHDLSRCTGEGDANLGRFNMPFELGIAVAAKWLRRSPSQPHEWRVMVPKAYPYPRYLSDLQGYDLANYDGTPADLAVAVVQWLKYLDESDFEPDVDEVLRVLPLHREVADACRARSRGHNVWQDILAASVALVRQEALIPGLE